ATNRAAVASRPTNQELRTQEPKNYSLLLIKIRHRQRFLPLLVRLRAEEVFEGRLLHRHLFLLQVDVAVRRHAGAGGDEAADDHVLLEAAQVIDAAGNGRLRQYARGLLERG